ncbi:hypothetical protein ACFX2I_009052 [Malus domestica]
MVSTIVLPSPPLCRILSSSLGQRSTKPLDEMLSSSPATQLQLSSNLCHTLHRPVAATPVPTRLASSSPNSTSHQTLLLSRNHRNEDNEQ